VANSKLKKICDQIFKDGKNPGLPFKLILKQLAFSLTINKSHGQTIGNVGMVLHDPVFSHGQLYVAFS
jgi:hypothetical protein